MTATTDDLFAHIRPAGAMFPSSRRIACRVCGLVASAHAGLVCELCAADVAKSRVYLDDLVRLAQARLEETAASADAAWQAASAEDRTRYETTLEAMLRPGAYGGRQKVLIALDRARSKGDGLSAILCAYDAANQAADALETAQRRWLNGMTALDNLKEHTR